MMQLGQYKITSNQVIYPSMDHCEIARNVMVEKLLETRPNDSANVFSKCVELTIEHKGKPSVKL